MNKPQNIPEAPDRAKRAADAFHVNELEGDATPTPSVGAWVPVGTDLPKPWKNVWVWDGSDAMEGRCSFAPLEWFNVHDGGKIDNVTHWQPLPAGPDAQRYDDCGITGPIIKPSTKGVLGEGDANL